MLTLAHNFHIHDALFWWDSIFFCMELWKKSLILYVYLLLLTYFYIVRFNFKFLFVLNHFYSCLVCSAISIKLCYLKKKHNKISKAHTSNNEMTTLSLSQCICNWKKHRTHIEAHDRKSSNKKSYDEKRMFYDVPVFFKWLQLEINNIYRKFHMKKIVSWCLFSWAHMVI